MKGVIIALDDDTRIRRALAMTPDISFYRYEVSFKLTKANGVGAIVFTILSAFDTFERERIAARIREVKQLKKSQGKFTGGRRAFGYEVVGGVKVPRDDEQVVIKEMIKMREKGLGYRDIAEWMSTTQERKMTFMGVRRTLKLALADTYSKD